ncbi:NYN domain-containing protein [Maritimibacter dapengensis]|uniref:NYN domain-containing protein n=1 Tax=Maritimibacter dapengensis TaxID=2836868 RepID=A0ABS6T5T8_9RHOB|nr:NYN domain-containing protein [Maritimibacter dapengensis]MBV7380588.1 NYN domain-containing protein [Maritimibacter dapengensis]
MTKVAILIDGGYFLKRLRTVRPTTNREDAAAVCRDISRLVTSHLKQINKIERAAHPRALLYRSFYYDARPYLDKGHLPISAKGIDYAKTDRAKFHLALHDNLRRTSNMAVRLGEVRRDPDSLWELKPSVLRDLLKKNRDFADLTDDDFRPTFRQNAVDMRIGLDIASITLKRQADMIVLVAGDSDFVPAAKLARREGIKFVLDPLWRKVDENLFEHIDGLRSGFPKPQPKPEPKAKA